MAQDSKVSKLDALRTHPAFVRVFSRLHVWLYLKSGGRILADVLGAPVLLLTTVGRKSGLERTTPLLYLEDEGRLVVVASNGGADKAPAWWLNLRAESNATVRRKGQTETVVGVKGSDADKARLWPKLNAMYPDYDLYQRKTERDIPVVFLDPVR